MNDSYVDPFSSNVQNISQQLDNATINKDVISIKNIIDTAMSTISNEDDISQAKLYYSIATGYGDIQNINQNYDEDLQVKQLYFYRKSVDIMEMLECESESILPYLLTFKCCLYTNYGNTLDICGRKISAIEQYQNAIRINSKFGMALGNLGKAYQHYADLTYNDLHKNYLHYFAYQNLEKAINTDDPNLYFDAKEYFTRCIKKYQSDAIEKFFNQTLKIPTKQFDNLEETVYREWGLKYKLFLNPLNDLSIQENVFANDEIGLPNMIVKSEDKPIFHGMFNQIKQEYVYARYSYYSALSMPSEPHFADKDTFLVDFADFPIYSIRIEKIENII